MTEDEKFDMITVDIHKYKKISATHIRQLNELGIPANKIYYDDVSIDGFISNLCKFWRERKQNIKLEDMV